MTNRAKIMGILNVTPDSFSDGGSYVEVNKAVNRAREMLDEGADIIDVGGESTRPGSDAVDLGEELKRVIPVIREISSFAVVSIDTKKREVAAAAIENGAKIINDISASLAEVARDAGAVWVAMHMQGDPKTMQQNPHYADVVEEVREYLAEKLEWARSIGVKETWIDPGLGFGKTKEQNMELLRATSRIVELGVPVLIGASRKGFLTEFMAPEVRVSPPAARDRVSESIQAATLAVKGGATIVRVHDVMATKAALDLYSEEPDVQA